VSQALNPCLMAFGLVFRRRMCLVAGIVGQVIVFGFTAQKSVLFSTVFVAALYFILKHRRRNFGLVLTGGLMALVLLSGLVSTYSKDHTLTSLITRRTLATPGLLTGYYFEHFSQVSHAGMGFHFDRWAPPYFGPPQEIGLVYFGGDVDANANPWAEGFAE